MRETARAQTAFNDYLALGADRSLENLLKVYREQSNPPTRHIATLKEWSTVHGWQVRLAAIAEQERQAIVARGVLEKQNRLDILDSTVKRLTGLIDARGNDPLCKAAGHETGLVITKKISYVPGEGGEEIARVEEYATDGVVLKELREYLKQAAQEKGEWSEGHVEALLKHLDLTKLSNEQLERLANGDHPLQVLLRG